MKSTHRIFVVDEFRSESDVKQKISSGAALVARDTASGRLACVTLRYQSPLVRSVRSHVEGG